MSGGKRGGQWPTRIGFILAAAGSAIGLGNIWEFPYIAGNNGGGAFVLVYLICVAVIGLPLMMAELMIGLAIFPIVFAVGMEPAQGPGLIFKTVPVVFSQIPGGTVLSVLFFLLLGFAALTSAISLLEAQVATLIDERGWRFWRMNVGWRGWKSGSWPCCPGRTRGARWSIRGSQQSRRKLAAMHDSTAILGNQKGRSGIQRNGTGRPHFPMRASISLQARNPAIMQINNVLISASPYPKKTEKSDTLP